MPVSCFTVTVEHDAGRNESPLTLRAALLRLHGAACLFQRLRIAPEEEALSNVHSPVVTRAPMKTLVTFLILVIPTRQQNTARAMPYWKARPAKGE